MLFEVRRQRIRGVPLTKEARNRVVPARGDLRVEEGPAEPMGRRLCRIATLHAVDRVVNGDSLPRLYDARLLWMAPLALVLGGIEFEGGTGYWQTWYCTPLDREPLTGMAGKPSGLRDSSRTRAVAPTCEAPATSTTPASQ
ncbi:hypothetical protein [Azohydromonas australica]|uniref:hypothetical protein n=1 Tax=Azohydromonas australica TaxID=364039 RepID=UPI0005B943F9|nr:hypothetical protein [Azohydromonas australica]